MAISFADNAAWPSCPLTWPPTCPPLAPGMARLHSCLAPGSTVPSECRRPSDGWCYGHPHDLPGHLPRNCCTVNRSDESIGDGEFGFGQAGLDAAPDHVQGFCSRAFDVLGQVQRLRQQGIAGHRTVRFAQFLQREPHRKTAGAPDLEPVREKHDLHAADEDAQRVHVEPCPSLTLRAPGARTESPDMALTLEDFEMLIDLAWRGAFRTPIA